MRQKVRFFRQHTMETCGISCILMILDRFHRVKYPTAKQERKLYALYRCRSFCGVLAASAADCLSRNRLEVALYHSSGQLMENRDGYYPPALFDEMLREYRETLSRAGGRIRVEAGCELSPGWVLDRLAEGKLVMLQCVVPGDADGMHDHVLHWVLCYGWEEGAFLVCDPMSRKIALTEAELAFYMDTPIGRVAITASDRPDTQSVL